MPIPILMPALSPTMEEGKLAKWHVEKGQSVSAGDVIAEIETDKATMEVEAVEDGKLGKILVEAGTDQVRVNTPIAVLLEEDETDADLENFDPAGGVTVSTGSTDSGNPTQPETSLNGTQQVSLQNEKRNIATVNGNGSLIANQETRIFASPLARRIATESGVDLSTISGTGPNGRIVKRDIESPSKSEMASKAVPSSATTARSSQTTTPAAPAAPAMSNSQTAVSGLPDSEIFPLYEEGAYELIPHDNMRQIIAERLVLAKSTIPHFYLRVDCELDSLLAARKRLNDASPAEGDNSYRLSVNDFIIKAVALALQKVPGANTTWTSQGILQHRHSDVSVAVAVEGGLFTPVIRKAESKTMTDISAEMKDLATRARSKRLAPHEYQGGTTSISNLGMFGIQSFDAVINPPHATILAVGQGEKRAVVKDGELASATLMSVSLSCDHRVVDGALGAQFLGAFKGFIEDPVTMLI